MTFSNIHVQGRDFFAADLRECVLENMVFEDTLLLGTRFIGINASGIRFLNCNMRGASFEGAHLSGAFFDGCDLRDAIFDGADLAGARFVGCVMSSCTFRCATLRHTGFRDVVLTDADFSGANMLHALFATAVVDGVKLTGAKDFFLSRALVTEALRQRTEGVLERLREVALIDQLPQMCWDAWWYYTKELEERDPLLFRWAMDSFASYPESRMADAFREGWVGARHSALHTTDEEPPEVNTSRQDSA